MRTTLKDKLQLQYTVVRGTVANAEIAFVHNAKRNEKRLFNVRRHIRRVIGMLCFGKIQTAHTTKVSIFSTQI